MGEKVSRHTAEATQENWSIQEVPEGDGLVCFGQVLPILVGEEVFLNVPPIDLVRSATRVCKNWHYILTDKKFWFQKVKREGFQLPAATKKRLTEEDDIGKALYVLQGISCRFFPLDINLIRNPSGKDGLLNWVVHHGGDGLRVECPPVGSNKIPEEAGLPTQHCFVSSFYPCSRSQTIILKDINIEPWIMDILRPEIQISEWVSARFDCHACSSTTVELLGETGIPTVCSKEWSSRDDGVVQSEWYQQMKIIVDCPPGLSAIKFTNTSQDQQFWAGYYGAKTAGSSVKLHL